MCYRNVGRRERAQFSAWLVKEVLLGLENRVGANETHTSHQICCTHKMYYVCTQSIDRNLMSFNISGHERAGDLEVGMTLAK